MDVRTMQAMKKMKDSIFAQAAGLGFSDFEVYYERGASFEVRIFKGEIAQYKNASPMGLSFRGTHNGRVGYAYTENLDEQLVPELLKNALDNASVIEDTDVERLYSGDAEYPHVEAYNPALDSYSVQQKITMAKEMEKYAYEADTRVVSVDYCVLGSGEGETAIVNSLGLDLSHRSNFCYAYAYVRVEENGVTKMALDEWHGNDFSTFSPMEVARNAVKKAVSYLGGGSCDSGIYPVVFDNISAISLFSTFINVFFAERVQKGFSLLKDKIGVKIAGDTVTIRDDGVCCQSIGSVPFDSEGVATKNKLVVQDGVLQTYLYNLKTAEKDGVMSTGNGFKPSFRSPVDTACTNFYIQPSQTPFSEMLSMAGNGILITELAGLHSGTNVVSGDFSLSADGFLIENGKIVRPLEQITVAGNFFTLLKDIVAVGDDLRFDTPGFMGTVGMPSIYVGGLNIAGL